MSILVYHAVRTYFYYILLLRIFGFLMTFYISFYSIQLSLAIQLLSGAR